MASTNAIWNIEWLNTNSQRRYPLHEGASALDSTGTFQIPNDFLVDLILPVHTISSIDPSLFHVLRVDIFGLGVSLTFGYNGTPIGSISIDSTSFVRNAVYYMQCTGNFFDSQARVVIGSLENIGRFAGSYNFTVATGRFEPHAIIPDIRGVSAIYLQNGTDVSDPITGDVILQAGQNTALAYTAGDGSPANPNRILVNAIDGAGLNTDCVCGETALGPCIQTINTIPPAAGGNFTLEGSECVALEAIANGLKIKDECAKPCCGCTELDVVTAEMANVVSQVNSLTSLAERLETAVSMLEFNLLAAVPWA